VLVFDGRVFGGGVPKGIAAATIRLVRSAGLRLGGAKFAVTERGWRFVDGSTTPDLRSAGSALVRALLPHTQ